MSDNYREFINAYILLKEAEEEYLRNLSDLLILEQDITKIKEQLYSKLAEIKDNETDSAIKLLVMMEV